jgi:hypothetical protein
MLLEEENSTLRLKSVLPNSLGDFYGLRNGNILCKPFTNEELEQNDKTLRKTEPPLMIEVLRVLRTSTMDLITSIVMPELISRNPFVIGKDKCKEYRLDDPTNQGEEDALGDSKAITPPG